MCGIAGILDLEKPVERGLLGRMTDQMRHRGPDHAAVFTHSARGFHVGLGYRRLSILDLSPAGNQPLRSENGEIVAVYNGEIYNHPELRRSLERKGHRFGSQTDGEVVVHAYEQYGRDCLRMFNGMFAFCLVDTRSRSLLIGRDRMGIKPLYYTWDGRRLAFASELRTILSCGLARVEVDPAVLGYYFSLLYVPSPHTIIRGVQKLMPASFLQFRSDRLESGSFWVPDLELRSPPQMDPAGLAGVVRRDLQQAVERQMRSDVPVGAFLSGGVDSSIITGLAAGLSPKEMHTFSVGYSSGGRLLETPENDDLPFARLAGQRFHTCHHEIHLDDRDLAASLPAVVAGLDEPLVESTALSQALVAGTARSLGIPVLLTGDGGDELFGGYPWYLGANRLKTYRRLPGLAHLLRWLIRLPLPRDLHERAVNLNRVLPCSDIRTYHIFKESNLADHKWDLLDPDLRQAAGRDITEEVLAGRLEPASRLDPASQIAWMDLALWIREFFNHRLDRISMLHSVEARVPFQDNQVVDRALSIPLRIHIDDGRQTKHLLRLAFRDLLPPGILNRPKRPYVGPFGSWLRGSLKGFLEERLDPAEVSRFGLLDPAAVTALLHAFQDQPGTAPEGVWAVLILQVWCRQYLTP